MNHEDKFTNYRNVRNVLTHGENNITNHKEKSLPITDHEKYILPITHHEKTPLYPSTVLELAALYRFNLKIWPQIGEGVQTVFEKISTTGQILRVASTLEITFRHPSIMSIIVPSKNAGRKIIKKPF